MRRAMRLDLVGTIEHFSHLSLDLELRDTLNRRDARVTHLADGLDGPATTGGPNGAVFIMVEV